MGIDERGRLRCARNLVFRISASKESPSVICCSVSDSPGAGPFVGASVV